MTSKKYEFSKTEVKIIKGRTLHRIRALRDIALFGVKVGDLGGFIESEDNLSHEGFAWVEGGAAVYGNSMVARDTLISGQAIIYNSNLWGRMLVDGNVEISNSEIKGKSLNISNRAILENVNMDIDKGKICGKSVMKNVFGRRQLVNFLMEDDAQIIGKVEEHMLIGGENIALSGNAQVRYAHAILGQDIVIKDNVEVKDGVGIQGRDILLQDQATATGDVTLRDNLLVSDVAHVFSSKGASRVGDMMISGDSVVDGYFL